MLVIRNWIKKNVIIILHVFFTVILCVLSVLFFGTYPDYLLAGNLVLALFFVYCFYRFVFKKVYADSFLKALCILAMIISANRLYSYDKLVELFPWLENVDHSWVIIGVMVILIVILLIFKLLTYIEPSQEVVAQPDATDTNNGETGLGSKQETAVPPSFMDSGNMGVRLGDPKRESFFSFLRFLCVLILFCILILIPAVLLYLFNVHKLDMTSLDFDKVFAFLVSYGSSFLLILSALIIIIISLSYIAKYIYIQIKSFKIINEDDLEKHYPVPTYAFSVIIVCVLLFFSWRVSKFSLDDLTEVLAYGRYLALPMAIVITIILFFILVQIIHAIILLLSNMSAEVIKHFILTREKDWRIGTRIIKIIGDIIDIILDTILTVLSFVKFIPNFFGTMSGMILNDDEADEEYDLEDEKPEDGMGDVPFEEHNGNL